MSINLNRNRVKQHLQNLNLQTLFIEELGWDYGGTDLEIPVADMSSTLEAIAHKRGMVAYQYIPASDDAFPDHPTGHRKICPDRDRRQRTKAQNSFAPSIRQLLGSPYSIRHAVPAHSCSPRSTFWSRYTRLVWKPGGGFSTTYCVQNASRIQTN